MINWSPEADYDIAAFVGVGAGRFMLTTNNVRVTTDISAPGSAGIIDDVLVFISQATGVAASVTLVKPVRVTQDMVLFAKSSAAGALMLFCDSVVEDGI